MWADAVRLVLLVASFGIVMYSAGSKFYEEETKVMVSLRKLSPQFTQYCGADRAGGVKEDSSQEKRRNECKKVVTDATRDAQEKCARYLENEKDCRQVRGRLDVCMQYTMAADGCVTMVVRNAVQRAGPKVVP
jgi:hypothetical protein